MSIAVRQDGPDALAWDLPTPYLLFVGDCDRPSFAKTAFGIRDWAPQNAVGQLRLGDGAVDLGMDELTPAAARARGARSIAIGVAASGGELQPNWVACLVDAVDAGLDIVSGLHTDLRSVPPIAAALERTGRSLHQVRFAGLVIPVGTGEKRSGRRLLTVGTDCAAGKKYTALAITRELNQRGIAADFRATGQTGIMIAGRGIAIDSVIADFVSGAAELLSPAAAPDHWDVVEGQGSLFHPSYAGVTLGLIHGTQPDAMLLCHKAGRTRLSGLETYPVPAIGEALGAYVSAARLTNPRAQFVGISVYTGRMAEPDRRRLLDDLASAHGLPCADPLVDGVDAFVRSMEALPCS
jgi:uncharacterized NAD-dependent epimerase/dehydratase family protein